MIYDNLAKHAIEGTPLDSVQVIDCHMHSTRVSHFFIHFEHGADLLHQMDLVGVDRGVFSSLWSAGKQWDSWSTLKAFCARAPGRFYAYTSPNPHWENYETVLKAQSADALVVGIKLHPAFHGKTFDCPEYLYTYQWAAQAGLPVLLHTWGTADIEQMAALADLYPKTSFVLGHSGGEEDAVALAAKMAAIRDNLYLDTACSYVWQGAVEYMVATAGAHKVLFGSDAYWNSIEASIGRILCADIEEDEKRQILGRNAIRLFRWPEGDDMSV